MRDFSSDVKLVTVRAFDGPRASLDAELARNVLKKEGILSALQGDLAAQVGPLHFGISGVQLLVREEDAARANDVLEALENMEAALPEDESPELPEKT
jgi:hypothetical protein